MINLFRDLRFIIGLTLLGGILIATLAVPILPLPDPNTMNISCRLQNPSHAHIFGTDEYGRDLLARVLVGTRTSLAISLGATILAAFSGTVLGVVSALARSYIDTLLMRSVDLLLTFPPIIVATIVVGLFGGSVVNLVLVLGILQMPAFARLAYGATKVVQGMPFLEAAQAIAVPKMRLLQRYILPNILSPLLVQFSITVGTAMLLESGLSFLGIGVKPPTASLGQIIGRARGYMAMTPSYIIFPSLLLSCLIFSCNLLGDALRDYVDPKLLRAKK
jgi:peptide/nickel transport system permease protein